MAIDGDLSYLNLDWTPVPIIPKFVDIVVNGIAAKDYDLKAYAQDPFSLKQRTDYVSGIYRDMMAKEQILQIQQQTGLNLRSEERRVGKECRSRWSTNH